MAVNNSALISKIGRALVQTHDYERAKRYYSDAIQRDPRSVELRLDLSELFAKLELWGDAAHELEQVVGVLDQKIAESGGQGASVRQDKVKVDCLQRLAQVHLR